MTMSGDSSAYAQATEFSRFRPPAPYVTTQTPRPFVMRAAPSAAKPTAGSWLSVISLKRASCSSASYRFRTKSPGDAEDVPHALGV